MKFTQTTISDVWMIDLDKIQDERGFFARSFSHDEFAKHSLNPNIRQANASFNVQKGTLRGLHFQKAPHREVKIVRCVAGAIYDVALDIRPESPTFTKWVGVELTAKNHRQLYIPEGCAHGFITLEPNTEVHYLVTEDYHPESEGGIRYDDPLFSVQWPLDPVVLSEKDSSWPRYEERL